MKNFVLWAVIAVAVLVLFSQFMPRVGQAEEVRYSTFLDEVRNGRVEQVVLQGEQILGTRKDKTVFRVYNPETDYTALIDRLVRILRLEGRCFYIHDQHLPMLLQHAASDQDGIDARLSQRDGRGEPSGAAADHSSLIQMQSR